MTATYLPASDSWQISTDSQETAGAVAPPAGNDWTAIVTVSQTSGQGESGIVLLNGTTPLLVIAFRQNPSPNPLPEQFEGPGLPAAIKIRYTPNNQAVVAYGFEGAWTTFYEIGLSHDPTHVALITIADTGSVSGFLSEFRVMAGNYDELPEEVSTLPPVLPPAVLPSPATKAEALVHALVGAQFGDLEFDVGKSVRWTQWFADDVMATDINYGTQRYWVVNWAETFPHVSHTVSGTNFFVNPTKFRREQFEAAQRNEALLLEDDDWVLFVDAHEGLSCDTRSLPDDALIEPFRSYVYREITRATAAGRDRIVVPFFAFLRDDMIRNVEFPHPAFGKQSDVPPTATQTVSVPYYLPYQGLTRILKVSALRAVTFDWGLIDRPTAVIDAAVKLQLISYGYAHWHLPDIVPPATTVPPLTEANDDGWRQRNLLSQVRPLPGLPIGAWQPPANDPAGQPGPWVGVRPPLPGGRVTQFGTWNDTTDTLDPLSPPMTAPTATTAPLLTPMYDGVLRLGMRDGVWYEEGVLGNVPLTWDATRNTWVPEIPPDQWTEDEWAVTV